MNYLYFGLIIITFIVKLGFIGTSIYYNYLLRFHGKTKEKRIKKLEIMKEQWDFVYVWLMSIILFVNFNPFTSNVVVLDRETKTLLFLYAIITVVTAKYTTFTDQSLLLDIYKNKNNKNSDFGEYLL